MTTNLLLTLGVSAAVLGSLSACGRPNPGRDAGGGTDVEFFDDVQDPMPDVPSDTGNNTQPDSQVATDATPDSQGSDSGQSRCGPDAGGAVGDLNDWWFYKNALFVGRHDWTEYDNGRRDWTHVIHLIKHGDNPALPNVSRPAPHCTYIAGRASGDNARNTGPAPNFGTTELVAQGVSGTPARVGMTYNSTTMNYAVDVTMGEPLPYGLEYMFRFAGGADGPETMANLRMPPEVPWNNFEYPEELTREGDNVFRVRGDVADPTGDLMLQTWIMTTTREHVTVCTVPACNGEIHVPGSVFNAYPSGQNIIIQIELARQRGVMVGTHPVMLRLGIGKARKLLAP